MQPQFLDGLIVATPWGRRTIRVVNVKATAGEAQTISYSFVQDPAVLYRLIIAPELLLAYPAEVCVLVSQWTNAGHLNGSEQLLAVEAVKAARDPIAPPCDSAATSES
jgi:hypothetical protein